MESTRGPSLSDPLDSQGRSPPPRSRSAVPPSPPGSPIREIIEISSDECEEIMPPRKKSRRADVNVPRKGEGPAKVRHLLHFFFRSNPAWHRGLGRLEQVVAVEKNVSSTPYVVPVIYSCVPRNLTKFKKALVSGLPCNNVGALSVCINLHYFTPTLADACLG